MAQVVVTHWVHPEVVSYLARFCTPLVPSAAEGVWPGARVTELAATADGLIACSVRRDMSLAAARQVEQALNGHRPDHAVNHPRRA
jgi:hypothetical protein